MRYLSGFLSCGVLLLILAAIVIYSGWYNVAATDPHLEVTRWALHETMHNSVKRQAAGIVTPTLTEEMAAQGMEHFQGNCVSCHGAPGVERGEAGQGLMPLPPNLAQVGHWTAAQLFWITKNGIKMTGMPAWGPTHSDEEIWAIVAFLERLSSLSPEQYAEKVRALLTDHSDEHRHSH